ncbi:polysaccharide biosynthesis/export family protein [Nodosilinea sp. E11]|uniref:polysaccharide biosynthesis/export family protein n=1 Tax=Nodosilinea sp. E11 TaxID=3037479 RepID=UPI002934677E|nr:polysaccharide biosynthesis/export family protein [Nodosilinea sp. E11]WOD38907.1 SLBB domain-containing protein [Nodosilinea sp. E11]
MKHRDLNSNFQRILGLHKNGLKLPFRIVLLLVLSSIFIPVPTQAQESIRLDAPRANEASVGEPRFPIEDAYRLGRSDEIRIRLFGVDPDFFERERYIIPVDGRLNLPWVGEVRVDGLTIREAETQIESSYAPFIKNPNVTVTLVSPRSLRVVVAGEIQRPGSYTLTPREQGVGGGLAEVGGNPNDWPTVITAIQAAGGLQQQADLRNVQLRRLDQNGSTRNLNVDLWALLQGENAPQDFTLRDGDTILVPTATVLDPSEAQRIAIANFSPDGIAINIAGEVKTPGLVDLRPNSSLNQAILAAGGFDNPRAKSGSANLIRLNPDGTVVNRIIQVDYSEPLNEETNPALREGDIVLISTSNLARTSDFLSLVGGAINSVINPIFQVLGIFNILNNNNN